MSRTEPIVNIDGDKRLTAGDQLAAVQLVDYSFSLDRPLIDHTAGVKAGEDQLVVLRGGHLPDLLTVEERVADDVLVGHHAVSEAEHRHLALQSSRLAPHNKVALPYLRLSTPDLDPVVTEVEAGHAVGGVGGAQLCEDEGSLPSNLTQGDQVGLTQENPPVPQSHHNSAGALDEVHALYGGGLV